MIWSILHSPVPVYAADELSDTGAHQVRPDWRECYGANQGRKAGHRNMARDMVLGVPCKQTYKEGRGHDPGREGLRGRHYVWTLQPLTMHTGVRRDDVYHNGPREALADMLYENLYGLLHRN